VFLDIEVGFTEKVLDLVDPWLQVPVFVEDGWAFAGRSEGHGQNKCNNGEN